MEVYLGLFPWLLALNFRNTFFPVWDLIMDNTFGKISGDRSATPSSRPKTPWPRPKKVDEGRQTAMRLQKIKDRATSQGLQAGSSGQNLTGYPRRAGNPSSPRRKLLPSLKWSPSSRSPAGNNESSARKIELAEFNQVRATTSTPAPPINPSDFAIA
jgi:hypothetical protein